MAIGKRLILLGCYASVATALLLVCIAAPAIVSLLSSGEPVCLPGVSIRCHESDCGRFFQRCGSTALLEVPADKVCYRGALLSLRKTDIHSCRSTTVPSNSSLVQSGIGACDCDTLAWPCQCRCKCQNGAGGSVRCTNPLKTYPSNVVAQCCLKDMYGKANCSAARKQLRVWELVLETAQRLFTELAELGNWSLQDAAASFTFRTPNLKACDCNVSGTCASVC